MPKTRKFKTAEEFARFVEEHDLAEHWQEFEDVETQVTVPRPIKKSITLRIYPYLLEQIRAISAERGIPYQTLIQQWLAEKVNEERSA